MKRKVGFTALIFAGIFILLAFLAIYARAFNVFGIVAVMYWGCCITAIICLFGDFIRFIGKMFSKGYSEGTKKSYSHYCPHCGKGLEQDACFCPGCGTKLN